jgi:CRP-like cAMP-binding protein
MERMLFLKRVSLFRHLPLDTLLAVSRALEHRYYLAGETVFEGNAPWEHFSIVESGAVDLLNGSGPAEHLRAPAHFGELVLADEAVRSPHVVAAEDCSLLRLHRIVFRDLSRDHPEVLMELCKLLAHQIRRGQAPAPASASGG